MIKCRTLYLLKFVIFIDSIHFFGKMQLLNSYIKIVKTLSYTYVIQNCFLPCFTQMLLSTSCIFKMKIYKSILPLLPETEKSYLKRPKWLLSAILFRCFLRNLSGALFGIYFCPCTSSLEGMVTPKWFTMHPTTSIFTSLGT